MIDPDQREQWAKDSAERRERCAKAGTHAYESTTHLCNVCGALDPKQLEPRVVLALRDLRAVFVPKQNLVVVERRAVDRLGTERWDEVTSISRGNSDATPDGKRLSYAYELITNGRAP